MTPSTTAGRFEISEEFVNGVQMPVFAHQPRTMREIWQMITGDGDEVAVVYGDERFTYGQMRALVGDVARHLAGDLGVRGGERIAIAMRNYPEWVVSFWAASIAGAVVVPLNAWWTGSELAAAIDHSGSTVLFADDERLARLGSHGHPTSLKHVIPCRSAGSSSAASLSFTDLIKVGSPRPPDVARRADDDALIMYTSGTTGRAKGTVLTHRNIGAHVMNSMWMAEFAGDAAAKPTTLMTFPLFHVGGLTSFLIPHALFGGKIVLMYKWDVDVALDLIEREGVKSVAGVPTTMTQLLDEAARQGRTLPSLGAVASGATTVPSRLVSRVGARKAAPMIGFGLTESAGAVTSNAGKQYLDRPQSVGRPVSPVMRFRIVDDEGNSLPPGEVGEIWVQGPTIFRAYLDDDEATAAALTDGWFHTGDLGRSDEDGFLYVVDRLKDVIIRGGENIYAAEVEVVLLEHPAVADAAVIGVPDDRLGEQVVAVVVADPGSVDAESLQAFVRDRLAGFKVPSIVEFTSDELPRNAGGKVLKRELQTRFSQQASRGEATTP